jgi:hypothetical protein
MLLSTIACPCCYDSRHKQHFDGKIGIWPFITVEPEQ